MKVLTLLFYFCLNSLVGFCQDTVFARKIVNELCSKKYAGRGYVNKGVNKAALFISSEYKKIGLQPLPNQSFFQDFNFPVNTFPYRLNASLNSQKLLPGIDYLVNESSGSGKGNCTILLTNNSFSSLPTDAIFIVDEKKYPNPDSIIDANIQNKAVVVLTDKKFTWSVASNAYPFPLVYVKRSLFSVNEASKKFAIDIKQKLIDKYACSNVIGAINGTVADTFIVLTAHYDHLGKMGKGAIFPGANDNASGIAMMLNFATYFKNNPSKYSILFIAFAGEEAGLIGSKYFVENSWIDLKKIKFLVNMDLMGSGKEGVTVVNGTIHPKEFEQLETINEKQKYLPEIKKRGEAANSDHYWFSKKGVPAFFIYTLGEITAYHDVSDIASKLPLTKYNEVFLLIKDFIENL